MSVADGPLDRDPESPADEVVQAGQIGGFDPADLAERFGTPLYVYDLDMVTRQVERLRTVLSPRFELAYAVKANPALGVVNHLGGLGLGADVASGGELEAALRAGIPAERIVMTGPGKRDEELCAAVRAAIRAITVESPGEFARVERIARAERRRAPILLRAATRGDAPTERIRLVGANGVAKFGMSPGDLRRTAVRAARSPHVDLRGLHAFGASNVLDAAVVADHIATTMAIARELARVADFELRLVDVGGGLGIPYDDHDEALDLTDLGRRLATLAEAWSAHPVTKETSVLLEPGRFLVGPAGAYLTRVVDRKRGRGGGEVVIVDGGIHHLLRPALVGQPHRVVGLGRRPLGASQRSLTIAGPLCSGLDILAADVSIGPLDPGDLVAILDVGAYGFTESMPFFLSHPMPAEVAIRDGTVGLLRSRLEPRQWLERQAMPTWS